MLKSVNNFNLDRAMKPELGKKESFGLKTHFKNEPFHFTPWLAYNLDEISKVFNVELINPSTEQPSENFKVDIEAELEDGSKVVIENQFGSSDHDHLGKIITYRTAHDAKVAIWIVEEARQEHIDSINWLNETDNGCDFYLLEAKLIKIENSPLALDLNKIAGPSNEIREKGKIRSKDARRFKMREKFWEVILNEFKNDSSSNIFKNNKPSGSDYINSPTGISGVSWSLMITQSYVTGRIYIDGGKGSNADNRDILNKFKKSRDSIEKSFGRSLEWNDNNGCRATTISYQLPGGWGDPEEKWPELANQIHETYKRFISALKGPISKLK